MPKVLVTGATGFLGSRLATRLIAEGYRLRALARRQSDVGALTKAGVEIAFGDLGDEPSVLAAVKGADIVVHAGAGTSGTAQASETATIQGTRNILQACRVNGVKKLVYISSCSVYEAAGYEDRQVVTEEAQLERFPLRRGHYTAAKRQAEALVTETMGQGDRATVVLRPGALYGPGAEVYTRMIGVSLARRIFVVFGDRESELPLLHVDNAVDAIAECLRNRAADNQVFNVVDSDRVTKKLYMGKLVKPLYPSAMVVYCPVPLLLTFTWLQEKLAAILGKRPLLTVYSLVASQKRLRYSTLKIESAIGWHSRISFEQGAGQLAGPTAL